MRDDTPDRWGEELGAPRTWLLYQITAPVLSRGVRVVSPLRFRTFPEPWLRPGFAPLFGDATPTEWLKTGAGQFKRLATPWARRVLRPTDQGVSHPSPPHSPLRRFAHSPTRLITVHFPKPSDGYRLRRLGRLPRGPCAPDQSKAAQRFEPLLE